MEQQQADQLISEAEQIRSAPYFTNFVAQSHSRAVLRRFNTDRTQWPIYTGTLDENLLYAAHLLLWNGLQLREAIDYRERGNVLIKQGAEILEFLYSELDLNTPDCLENLFTAALGYYTCGYFARAYVMMRELGANGISRDTETTNQQFPYEYELLRLLFLKDFSRLRQITIDTLTDIQNSDASIAARISNDVSEEAVLDQVLRVSLTRCISYFLEYPKNGRPQRIEQAIQIAEQGAALAKKLHFVSWWWLFYCVRHLFDEFNTSSFWSQLRPLIDGGHQLVVEQYIRSSYRRSPRLMEFWPSQLVALPRVLEPERRSYCLKMPTSAGKTRVAELAILQFLIDHKDNPSAKCIYLAPFRSLAVEIEQSLSQSFQPMGVRVSELYGGFELSPVERLLLEKTRVIVATPEKCDAFIRYSPDLVQNIQLIIIDEGHIVSATDRGVRFEVFLQRLIRMFGQHSTRFLFISAVLPNVSDFAEWITGDAENVISSNWRPTRLMIGELRWNRWQTTIYYTHVGDEPIEHECYVRDFVPKLEGTLLKGTRRRNPFPHSLDEVIADAALRFAQQDMTLVFVAQKRSVEPFGETLLSVINLKEKIARKQGANYQLNISVQGNSLIEEAIQLAQETMGEDARIIEFLKAGFAVHHADLPSKLRLKIEELARSQAVKLVIATTTLAQGVNMPIRTVIVHSLLHGHEQPVSPLDFWNICGRAGRGMKEKEGQVLFAVELSSQDPVLLAQRNQESRLAIREAKFREKKQAGYRVDLIEGYRTYKLHSGLAQLLRTIVDQWRSVFPKVDVAELCQLLAENDVTWIEQNQLSRVAETLDFLDAQILALTEDNATEPFSPDDLQSIMQRSLMALQLQKDPLGEVDTELANRLLNARLASLRSRFSERARRQSFYKLGFRISDCLRIEASQNDLLALFASASQYTNWSVEERVGFFVSVLSIAFELTELDPNHSSMSRNLKESWREVWQPILNLWLRGNTSNEIVTDLSVSSSVSSASDVSILIDALFVYRAPWGINAISAYLRSVIEGAAEQLPEVAAYFSALIKYGVHSPVASGLIALGLDSRKLSLRLSAFCPHELMEPQSLQEWLVNLSRESLVGFGFDEKEIGIIEHAQRQSGNVLHPRPRKTGRWTLNVSVQEEVYRQLNVGDGLILGSSPSEEKEFSIYSLAGKFIGRYKQYEPLPASWFSLDMITVTVSQLQFDRDSYSAEIVVEEV